MSRRRGNTLHVVLAGDTFAGVTHSRQRAKRMEDELAVRLFAARDPRKARTVTVEDDGKLNDTGLTPRDL